jgi:hypothetical protein
MKLGVYSIKNVLVSEKLNVVMKDNIYINKLTKIKEVVKDNYPTLYKKHTLKNILQPNINVRRIVNWSMIFHELNQSGYLDSDKRFYI